MLYYLYEFRHAFSPLNIFQYITFRSGMAFLTALGFCLFIGPSYIRKLRFLHMDQNIRDYAPVAHRAKAGTPTMGGLLILSSMVLATLMWARLDNIFIGLVLFCAIYLGFLGLLDDAIKWIRKYPERELSSVGRLFRFVLMRLPGDPFPVGGVSKGFKIFSQILLTLIIIFIIYTSLGDQNLESVIVPFLKDSFLSLHHLYIPFVMIVIIGSSNAVNLTDGLDGLAVGTLLVAALTFGVFSYVAGHAKLAEYLRIVYVPGAGELSIYLAAMAGACLGFLWFNSYPAEIFMGDAGSLFMGGSIGVVAVLIKQELILVVVGGVFVAEAVSVLLQVASYRTRGKRIFRMAPLHHHFELGGIPETKVTIRFWIISVILALIALSSLKLR